MYAAYLAAVEDTPAPVLSDAAEDTAAGISGDTTAAEDVAAEDTPAASSSTDAAPASGDHAPGDLSTFAATPGAPSIIPAF